MRKKCEIFFFFASSKSIKNPDSELDPDLSIYLSINALCALLIERPLPLLYRLHTGIHNILHLINTLSSISSFHFISFADYKYLHISLTNSAKFYLALRATTDLSGRRAPSNSIIQDIIPFHGSSSHNIPSVWFRGEILTRLSSAYYTRLPFTYFFLDCILYIYIAYSPARKHDARSKETGLRWNWSYAPLTFR